MSLDKYRKAVHKFDDVSVYQIPERNNLGACLNFAIARAKYSIVAKFDDDDYYAGHYISRSMRQLLRSGADIVGKRSFYLYLRSRKLLLLMQPNREHRFTGRVAGATFVFHKRVFDRVKFSIRRKSGSTIDFLRRSHASGFKIYSGDRFNYMAIRRKNRDSHTWKITDRGLLAASRIVARTLDYKKIAGSSWLPKDDRDHTKS